LGGNIDLFGSGFGLGSDAINTGHNSAGNGGSGHFSGNIIDASHALYTAINIAIAGYNAITDAHQPDHGAMQIAGIVGDGGHVNLAPGGDVAGHALADHHLLLG